MAEIQGNDMRIGTKIEYEGDAWIVEKVQHRTPGNLRAFVQVRMRSLTSGRGTEVRFSATERVPLASLDYKKMQFLYQDDSGYVFMENDSFEQVTISPEDMGDAVNYLQENMEVNVQYYRGRAIGIDVPTFVEMEVVETDPGARGDTVSNVFKPAKLPTGLVVQVPLFINTGDVIRVDTRTGEYVTRVSKA